MDQSSIHQRQNLAIFLNLWQNYTSTHAMRDQKPHLFCIIKRWSTSASTYFSTYILIGKPQLVVYPPCLTCVSIYHSTLSYILIGRPQLVVYPPRNICCHVLLYVCYWVDHNLWSTLHACIVSPRFLCILLGRP